MLKLYPLEHWSIPKFIPVFEHAGFYFSWHTLSSLPGILVRQQAGKIHWLQYQCLKRQKEWQVVFVLGHSCDARSSLWGISLTLLCIVAVQLPVQRGENCWKVGLDPVLPQIHWDCSQELKDAASLKRSVGDMKLGKLEGSFLTELLPEGHASLFSTGGVVLDIWVTNSLLFQGLSASKYSL